MTKPRWWVATLIWLAAIATLAAASPYWRTFDWWLFAQTARASAPPLLDAVALVDLPYVEDVGPFRQRLIDLLRVLQMPENRPRALVLDIEIVAKAPMEAELAEALAKFRPADPKEKCGVYAVIVPYADGKPDVHYAERLPRKIYEEAICAQGHTMFGEAFGLAKYDPLYKVDEHQRVPALVIRVAEDHLGRRHDADDRPIVVRLGEASALRGQMVRYDPAQRRLVPEADGFSLRDRIVVVGSLERDRQDGAAVSNPAYVLWALSARGLPPEQAEARLLVSPWLLFAIVVACGAIAAGAARWAYTVLRVVRSHPWLIAVVAGAVPLLLLWGTSAALAAADRLLPQLSLPAIGGITAGLLAWNFVRRYREWSIVNADAPTPPAEYDVFVSYSRTDPAHVHWVKTRLVEPLRRAARPDGQKYRVFFDTDDIGPGDAWIERIFHAIDASRFFLPVYSSDYFDVNEKKQFCRREIRHAFKNQRPGRDYMIPVDRVGLEPPSPYGDIQAIRVNNNEAEILKAVLATMERGLRADMAAKAAPEAPQASAPVKAA